MAATLQPVARFKLPARILSKVSPCDGYLPRLALASRIAELADIVTVENARDTFHFSIDVFLKEPAVGRRAAAAASRVCSVDSDDLRVYGLQDYEKYRVLSTGWGRLHATHVAVYLPRDDNEVEVCWKILQRAYDGLQERLNGVRPVAATAPPPKPYFFRSNLQ